MNKFTVDIKPLASWLLLATITASTIPAFREYLYMPWIISVVLFAISKTLKSPNQVAIALALLGIPILSFIFPPPIPTVKTQYQFAIITILWVLASTTVLILLSLTKSTDANQSQSLQLEDEASPLDHEA